MKSPSEFLKNLAAGAGLAVLAFNAGGSFANKADAHTVQEIEKRLPVLESRLDSLEKKVDRILDAVGAPSAVEPQPAGTRP